MGAKSENTSTDTSKTDLKRKLLSTAGRRYVIRLAQFLRVLLVHLLLLYNTHECV